MTRISQRKTRLTFVTDSPVFERGRNRDVVVMPSPLLCTMRLAGQRRAFSLPWAAVFQMAVKAQVDAARRERKAAKKAGNP